MLLLAMSPSFTFARVHIYIACMERLHNRFSGYGIRNRCGSCDIRTGALWMIVEAFGSENHNCFLVCKSNQASWARLSLVKNRRTTQGDFDQGPRRILIRPSLVLDDEHDVLVRPVIRSPFHGRHLMDDRMSLLVCYYTIILNYKNLNLNN